MASGDCDQVSDVLSRALEQPPERRSAFIRQACGADAALAAEVESLLDAHVRAGGFAEQPAFHRLRELAASDGDSSAPAARRLEPGARLGPYEIVAFVGAGGMGEVYTAHDTRLHRKVAIKVLPKPPDASEGREQFEREAMAVAALRHPHICVLYDIGTHEGIDYFVMEHLDGETLAAVLAKGPMPLSAVLRYASDIAGALAETHRRGVVHRDLKPTNIMLTATGAKLLDFGVATLRSSSALIAAAAPGAAHAPARTSGVGTLEYMAPEQIEGREVDGRTDLFGFGAVLYEMVTRTKAFAGETPLSVVVRILEGQPLPLPANRNPLLERLDGIIRRCLAKAPGERWQRAEDLEAALSSLQRDLSTRGNPVARSRLVFAAAAASLVIMVGALVTWRAAPTGPAADTPREASLRARDLALGDMRLLTLDEQLETDPRISPDGRFVAYSAGTLRQRRIFVRPIRGGAPVAVTSAAGASEFQPRWSPDGREILFVTPAGVAVVAASGGVPTIVSGKPVIEPAGSSAQASSLEEGFAIQSATWSPDGRRIATTSGGTVDVLSRDGGERRRVLEGYSQILHSCDWSPDARWLACVAGNWVGSFFGNLAPSELVIVPLSPGPAIELATARAVNLSPVWSPDSRRVYFVSNRQGTNDVYAIDVAADGHGAGDPVRMTTGLNAHSVALSADGRQLAYAVWSSRANIWSVPIPVTGRVNIDAAHPITTGNQTVETLRVSLSRKWLLYDSNQHGNGDIFRVPIGGGAAEQLTTEATDEFAPDLSPDDRWLAYHSWRDTSRDVVVRAVGGGPIAPVAHSSAHETYPMWSPDGAALALYDATVQGGVFRGPRLLRRTPSGGWDGPWPIDAASDPCRPPIVCRVSWSPDGRWLAYAHAGEVKVVRPDAGPSRVVYAPSAGVADPRAELVLAGDDSRTLYFKSHDAEGRASLWSVPVSGGRPVLLVRFDDLSRPSARPDFAVGAGRFFFTIEDRRSNIWVANMQ